MDRMHTSSRAALLRRAALIAPGLAALACGAPGGNAPPAPVKAQGPVEVISWGEGDPSDAKWQRQVDLFQANYPGLTVNSIVAPFTTAIGGQDYTEKVVTLTVAGTAPDVTFSNGTQLSSYIERDMVRELNPFMARDKFDKSQYLKVAWIANERKGRTLALPFKSLPYPFFLNLDLYEKAGLKPSAAWTWDDLIQHGRRLTPSDGSQWAIDQMASTISRYAVFVWGAGGDFFAKDYSRCTLDSEQAVRGLQFVADLVNVHRVHLPPGTRGFNFASGNVAITGTNPGQYPTWPFKWAVSTAPKGPASSEIVLITSDWAMLKGARNPEGGWRLLQWLTGEQGQKVVADQEGLPSHLKTLRQSTYPKADKEIRDAILRAIDTGRPLPYDAPMFGDIRPMWENVLPSLWEGKVTARELMQRVVPPINERLKNVVTTK
jgi:multiple sugar transport system substrate-binding protein